MHTEHPTTPSAWFPPEGADERPVTEGSTLPRWALTEIGHTYDRTDGPVRFFHLPRHTGPAAPRPALANRPHPGQPACLNCAVALVEPDDFAAMDSELVLVHFFRRLRTVLVPGATLAVHTRIDHAHESFTDPGGRIVLAARKTGLIYRQHLVLIHDTPQTQPTPLSAEPAAAETAQTRHRRPRPIHTDLYIFTSPEWSA